MRRFLPLATAALCGLLACGAARAQGYVPAFETFTLKNGLSVVLHRDTTLPSVSVHLAYAAGSGRDPKGRAGLSSLAAELFPLAGARYTREDLLRLRRDARAGFGAQTGVDWVDFASFFPATLLDTALTIEADRMRSAPAHLREDQFQRLRTRARADLVRRRGEPLGRVDESIYAELYPEGHPYRHLVQGVPEQIDSISFADLRAFVENFYCPANASLTIGGNFDAAGARAAVERLFGDIPAGRRLRWVGSGMEPQPIGQAGFISEEVVRFNRLILVFPTVGAGDPDLPALDILARVLGGSGFARLNQLLLAQRPDVLALDVAQQTQELDGSFWITVTAKVETRLQELYDVTMRVLRDLATKNIGEDELREARNRAMLEFLTPMESFYGFGGRCDLLNLGMLQTGNPAAPFTAADAAQNVPPSTLRGVAARYLHQGNVLVVSVVPTGKKDLSVSF